MESVRADKEAKPPERSEEQTFLKNKGPLKVNYLTPMSEIASPEIYVYKEKRRLYVVQSDVLVRDYPIGLGFCPKGDKEKRGDGRTPEGDFFICVKNGSSRFEKSLGLSYPTRRHAEKAFFADLINPFEYRDILLAVDGMGKPPWNTPLGGEIFIHGGGAMADWTEGCVALYDSDMRELFTVAGVGTPVSILP
jgi:murein L,D-transpeptidase YafK